MKNVYCKKDSGFIKKFSMVIVLAAFIVTAAFFSLAAKTDISADAEGAWDGSAAQYFSGGYGNEDNPFLISNASELKLFSDIINNGADVDILGEDFPIPYTILQMSFYKLTADIVLNDETFTFDPDTGLVIMTDGINTAYLGTGIKGDWSGANTYFDTTASDPGKVYTDTAGTEGAYTGTVNGWAAIGTGTRPFKGNFDGDGHTVSGLYINNNGTVSDIIGLFGDFQGMNSLSKFGQIKNVGVINNYIRSNGQLGGLAGSIREAAVIENCYHTGIVTGGGETIGVGGIAGIDWQGIIKQCYNTGIVCVNGTCSYAGGISGNNYYGKSEDCYNTGDVSGFNLVGGIDGESSGGIINCYNLAKVWGMGYLGGIAGKNNNGYIVSCYNAGPVSGLNNFVGGITGLSTGNLFNSYNTGSVSSLSSCVGGIVGMAENMNYVNCYNIGSVTGSEFVGAIAGYNIAVLWGCYYLPGCATDGNGVTQFGVGNWQAGQTTPDYDGEITTFDTDGNLSSVVNIGNYTGVSLVDALSAWVDTQTYTSQYFYWRQTAGVNNGYPYFDTREQNYWYQPLAITGWTYGESPNAPTASMMYGTPVFTYSDSKDGEYTDTVPLEPGTWWVKAEVEGTDTYRELIDKLSFEISKIKLTKPTAGGPYTYTGEEITVAYDGFDDTKMSVTGDLSATDAGAYTLTFELLDPAHYDWADGSDGMVEWTIEKLKLAKPAVRGPYTYTGLEITVTYDGFDDTTMNVSGDVSAVNAGAYNIMFELLDPVNYEWADGWDGLAEWTIEKVKLPAPAVNGTYTYTGEELTVTYDGYNISLMTVSGDTSATDAGDYTLTFELVDVTNYEWEDGADGSASWTIAQAINSWTVSLSIEGWTYGEAAEAPTAEAKFGTAVFTYSDSENGVYTATVPSTPGTWWVKAAVAGTDNYSGLEAKLSFTIARIELSEPTVTGTYVYNGSEHTVTYGGYDDTKMSVSGDFSATNAGTYTLTFELLDPAHYDWADGADGVVQWMIGKAKTAEPTISGEYTYDGTDQTVSYDGYDDTKMSVSGDRTGRNAGIYTLIFTIIDSNYEWAEGSDGMALWTIEQATNSWTEDLSVSDRVYSDTVLPTAEAEFGTVVFTYSDSEDGTYSTTAPVNAGTWWVKAAVAETADYTGLEGKASFAITKATLTDNTADKSVTYDGAAHGITLTFAGFKYSDNISAATLGYKTSASGDYQATPVTLTHIGSVTVYYRAVFNNYNTIEGEAQLTVTKRAVSLVIDNKVSKEGQTLLPFTYSPASGSLTIVDSDDPGIVLTKEEGSTPGRYAITGTAGNADYEITFTDGVYTINVASVTERVSGGEDDPETDITVTSEDGFDPDNNLVIADSYSEISGIYNGNDKLSYSINITYLDKDGNAVQVPDTLRVGIKIDENPAIKVYKVAGDGTLTELECRYENEELLFDADSAGNYALLIQQDEPKFDDGKGLEGWEIALIVIGSVFGAGGIGVGVFFLLKRLRKNK